MKAELCGGCGRPLDETTDAENMLAYRVPVPRRCYACTAVSDAVEKHNRSDGDHEAWAPGALQYDLEFHPPRDVAAVTTTTV